MSLRRQLQRRAASFARDGGLLAALRSEIDHELSYSSPPPPSASQNDESGNAIEGFALERAHPSAQDVLLRRLPGGGEEEIAVSALLAPLEFKDEDPLPRNALMKVCISKPGKYPILQFDCTVFNQQADDGSSHFAIKDAVYHPSMGALEKNKYRGPFFSSLDPRLQKEFKDYLVSRGITPKLTNFLLEHLNTKEHNQYVTWLHALESTISKAA